MHLLGRAELNKSWKAALLQMSTKAIVVVFIKLRVTRACRAATLVNLSWTTRWECVLKCWWLLKSSTTHHKECLSNWEPCFYWSIYETISIILDLHTAPGGDAAARFNFQDKNLFFLRIELRVSLLFPEQTEVYLGEHGPDIFQTTWLGMFEVACLQNSVMEALTIIFGLFWREN